MSFGDGLRSLFADTRPLQQADFRRLWVANIVTVIGAQLTVVAVPAQIYAVTGSSGMVGLTGLFGLVPLVVFGLWGGALADSMDRRVLLEFTTTGMIVTSGLFWLQAFLGLDNVWVLLGIFSLQQAFFAINQPARTAILPKLLPSEQLPAANALSMTVVSAGAIAGPMVGGALIPVLGYAGLYLIDTVLLFATLYAVWRPAGDPRHRDRGRRRAGLPGFPARGRQPCGRSRGLRATLNECGCERCLAACSRSGWNDGSEDHTKPFDCAGGRCGLPFDRVPLWISGWAGTGSVCSWSG